MAYSRVIPNYDLYGEEATPGWSSSFNFEWIPQRSKIYNWIIQPHRHESFLQILYLKSGYVDVQINEVRTHAESPCLLVVPAGHIHGFHFSDTIDGPVVTATQKALESVATSVMPELLETIRTPRILSLQPEMRYIGQLMPLFLAIEQESHTHASWSNGRWNVLIVSATSSGESNHQAFWSCRIANPSHNFKKN
jgi:AraC family transcriptional activator of pobA